ncbi:MAG TPA: YgjV family protein [Candidatus Dormibacteraeota bacterium]|nr:YgjV family protein [Candidatus Dormibacteraeota bacterium]
MVSPVIVQGIGFVAVGVSLCIFQTNKRKNMLLLSLVASLLYTAHFFLLGAITGSAMNLSGAVRSYVYYKVKPSAKNTWIMFAFLAITLAATALTWQGYISLLPMVGTVSGVVAYWQRKPKLIRRLGLISPPAWFVYNAVSGSYAGMFIEVINLSSNLIGQYRFDLPKGSRYHKLSRSARSA